MEGVKITHKNIQEQVDTLLASAKVGEEYKFLMLGNYDKDVLLELCLVLATGLYKELSQYYSEQKLDELFKLIYMTAKE